MKNKIFGTFEDGYGETIPATKKARWLRLQFRSNRKKNAGVFSVSFRFFNFFPRLLLLLLGLALVLGKI